MLFVAALAFESPSILVPDFLVSIKPVIAMVGIGVLMLLLLTAAVGDARYFRITNRLNLLILLSFLPTFFAIGATGPQWVAHILIFAICTLVMMGLFMARAFGGGDAKMISALSIWMGQTAIYQFLIYTVFCGGLLSLLLLASRGLARRFGLPKNPRWLRQLMRKGSHVPYGIAITIGAILALPSGPFWPTINQCWQVFVKLVD